MTPPLPTDVICATPAEAATVCNDLLVALIAAAIWVGLDWLYRCWRAGWKVVPL